MRRSFLPFAAAVGVAASVALSGTALAAGSAPDLACNGSYPPGTYHNVTVPDNGNCVLTDSTVLGKVTVEINAWLTLQGSGSIGGNLRAGNNANVYEDFGWTVNGTTLGKGAYQMTLDGTLHNVLLNNTQDVNLYATTINGNFVSNNALYGVGIGYTTKITGNVVVNDTSSAASYYIDSNPEIDGSVIVTNNQASGNIDNNVIKQNLACYGNTPPPFNFTNQVGGRSLGQCATEHPLPSASAS